MSTSVAWYAVQTRSRHEKAAAGYLSDAGLETFLPLYRRRSARRDRAAFVDEPLFGGYLFARFDYRSVARLKVLKAPGFVRTVGFGELPAPVPEPQIEALTLLVGGDQDVCPFPFLQAGQRVRVVAGPFQGVEGFLVASAGENPRLVVSIELLGRSVSVKIDRWDVRPLFE